MIARGDFVVLTIDGREPLGAFVALASPNGKSLIVMFDGMIDGHVGAMALHFDDAAGVYRSLFGSRPIGVTPRDGGPVQ